MNRICYYNGERVFPDYTSNIGFSKNDISCNSLMQCKCGSIISNIRASLFSHIKSGKHKNYIRNTGDTSLSYDKLFTLYRI